jgi:uncharacterized protein
MAELRYFGTPELRVAADGKQIAGYAARYNVLSHDLGGFRERIAPKAFERVIAAKDLDAVALFNHQVNYVLGRTSAGTLRLSADRVGLRFECDLPNTTYAHDLHESVKRGDINQVSFGFTLDHGIDDEMGEEEVPQEDRSRKPQRCIVRTIRNFQKLLDISPCTSAAYPGTSISARIEDVAVEVRTFVAQLVGNHLVIPPSVQAAVDEAINNRDLSRYPLSMWETRQIFKRRKMLADCLD